MYVVNDIFCSLVSLILLLSFCIDKYPLPQDLLETFLMDLTAFSIHINIIFCNS